MFNVFNKYIRWKVSLIVFILLIATTSVYCLITLQIMNKNIMNEILKRGEELSRSIAVSAGYNFLSKDLLGLDNIVFKIKNSNKDVEYITIIGTDKKTIVHSDINQIGKILKYSEGQILKKDQDGTFIKEVHGMRGTIFEVFSPIAVMNKSFGTVILGINKSVLLNAQNATRKRIMGAFTVTVFLGVIGSVILSSFLTRSIKELSSGVDKLKQGKRSSPLTVYSEDELGRLTKSFNEMSSLITNQQDRLNEYARELEEAYVSTVKVLAAAIDAKDPYTHGHSTRVSQLSLQLGREAGLGKEELQDLEISCLFHDVGKIRIPDKILRKKGKLREDEMIEMRQHPVYGEEILGKAPSLNKFIPAVRHHHEWYNGEGYPDGLRGHRIPLHARILSITDTFDAMTSDRHYRKALTVNKAKKELLDFSGKQFDPELINIFVKQIKQIDKHDNLSLKYSEVTVS